MLYSETFVIIRITPLQNMYAKSPITALCQTDTFQLLPTEYCSSQVGSQPYIVL